MTHSSAVSNCWFISVALLLGCAADTAVFRFDPEEGATYRVTETEEVEETTTARAGIAIERSSMEAVVQVQRPDSWRWAFVMTPEQFEMNDRGRRLGGDHPLVAAFVGTPITVEVWEDGTVGSVNGLEEIDRKFLEGAGMAGAPPALGLAFRREVEEGLKADWAERVAALIGREAAVGESWTESLELPLPSGGSLTVAREVTFEDWEACGGSRCARLRHVDSGGGSEWSGAIEEAVNRFARELCPNAGEIEVLEVTISGEGERFVEPGTLFTHRADLERLVVLRVRVDGEEREVSRRERATVEAERTDREEV